MAYVDPQMGSFVYLSTACRICVIHVFLSSLEVVWISYISGSLEEAQMRNMAFSSWATSLTMSFCREMTDGLLSWGENQRTQRTEDVSLQGMNLIHSVPPHKELITGCVCVYTLVTENSLIPTPVRSCRMYKGYTIQITHHCSKHVSLILLLQQQ